MKSSVPAKFKWPSAKYLIVLFGLNNLSYAQQTTGKLTIKGDLGPISSLVSKVFLQRTIYDYTNWGYHSIMDSCICKEGKYSFKAELKDAAWSVLQIVYDTNALRKNGLRKPAREYRAIELICYKENVTVSTIDSFFNNSIIEGSKATNEYLKFQKNYQPLDSSYRAKLSECSAETDVVKFEKLRAQADSLKKEVLLYVSEFFKQNPGTLIYPVLLQNVSFFPEEMDQKILQSLYNNLNKDIKASIHGREIKNKLDALNNVKMGRTAIDFSRKDTSATPTPTPTGETVSS